MNVYTLYNKTVKNINEFRSDKLTMADSVTYSNLVKLAQAFWQELTKNENNPWTCYEYKRAEFAVTGICSHVNQFIAVHSIDFDDDFDDDIATATVE